MLADEACKGIVENDKVDRLVGPTITKASWSVAHDVAVPEGARLMDEIGRLGFVKRDDECSRLDVVDDLCIFR